MGIFIHIIEDPWLLFHHFFRVIIIHITTKLPNDIESERCYTNKYNNNDDDDDCIYNNNVLIGFC